jgi:long-chain acyl-CoA synthetase
MTDAHTDFSELNQIDGCDTLSKLFLKRVAENAGDVALREKDLGIWNEYRWADYGEQAKLTGLGLMALGLERGDVCSVASEINREWMFVDMGIICAGGVVNGVYPTDASNQVEYLVTDSATRFYFAEDEEQLDKILDVRENTPTLSKIIIFDMEGLRDLEDEQCLSYETLLELGRKYEQENPGAWEGGIEKTEAEDLMVLTYTSGTTGLPKGSMINHRNALYQTNVVVGGLDFREGDEVLGFLPLAHIAGRVFYIFCLIGSRCRVKIIESLETVERDMQEVAPTVHFAVPRV